MKIFLASIINRHPQIIEINKASRISTCWNINKTEKEKLPEGEELKGIKIKIKAFRGNMGIKKTLKT